MSYLELRDISKVYGEGAAEVHRLDSASISPSTPGLWWPSWAPAAQERARC